MELIINDKNEIVGFNYLSREGIQIDQEEAPDEMLTDFLARKWLWSSDEIVVNPDYQEPTVVDPGPSEYQQQLAELIKDNAQQTTLNAQLIKQVAALQTHTDTTQEVK